MRTVKTLFSRKWILPTIVVILGVFLLLRLGIWQLDRLEERRAANVELIAALESPPFDLADGLPDGELSALENREIVATGVYDLDEQIVLKVQNWQGRAGVHLVTPLLLDGLDTAVLVDRGWIPQSDVDEGTLGNYDFTEPVQLAGYLALSQIISRNEGNTSVAKPQSEMYRIDIDTIQAQLDYEILPMYVIESPPMEALDELPLNEPRDVEVTEGSHMSYALQWFSFSIMLVVIYLVYVHRAVNKVEMVAVDEAE